MADRRTVLSRRLRTIPVLIGLFLASWALSPALAVCALAVDAIRAATRRTPWMAIRLVAMLLVYVTAELLGLIALGAVWVAAGLGANGRLLTRGTFAIQRMWAGTLFAAVCRIFRLDLDVEGSEQAADPPYLLLARHASIVDNLLPSQLVTAPHGTHIRYVIKDELLSDPAIDVAGNRLGNYFVRRGSGEREMEPLRAFAAATPDDEAILIYPEGTRFTLQKRDRALDRLSRRSPRLHALAAGMTSVLPPRPGGTLALMEGRPSDVVLLAHRGLEGFASIGDIWRGGMVGRTIRVRFTRVPGHEVPSGRSARTEWLFALWSETDAWIRTEGGS